VAKQQAHGERRLKDEEDNKESRHGRRSPSGEASPKQDLAGNGWRVGA
jgi:hypothetical protein